MQGVAIAGGLVAILEELRAQPMVVVGISSFEDG
jgi:hypothetical protein